MTTSGTDKQQLIDSFGDVAARLVDQTESLHSSLSEYLIANWLGGSLPAETDRRRRQAMRIAALATLGRTGDDLVFEVEAGLDAGMAAAEVVEVMIHVIPYAGIPKPLNSLLATKDILRPRGLLPVQLHEPTWTAGERVQIGERQITHAHPTASSVLKVNLAEIAPSVFDYIVTTAFADVYGRPGLSYEQRQPATIVSLSAQEGVQNHLATHVNGALNIGISPMVIVGALIDVLPLVEPGKILASVETAKAVFVDRGVEAGESESAHAW